MSIPIDRLAEITNDLYKTEEAYVIGPFSEVKRGYSSQMLVAPRLPSYSLQRLNDFQKILQDRLKPDDASLAKIAPGRGHNYNLGFLRFNCGRVVKGKEQYLSSCFVNIYPSPELAELALYGILVRDLIMARKLFSHNITLVRAEGYGIEKYGGWDTLSLTQNLRLMSDNLFSNKIQADVYKVLLETYLADMIGAHGHHFISVKDAIQYLDKEKKSKKN